MEKENIIKFRESIKDFTLEELEAKAEEIRNAISKMILDSDLILEAAIIDSAIKEKKGE